MKAKMFYTQQFGKKTFHGTSTKDAYLSACKWYASNIIAKDKFQSVQVEYIKESDGSITMVLYTSLPEKEVMEQHCTCCKEMHHAFFINEDTHCDRCSAISFQKRLEQKLSTKIGYYKEILRKVVKAQGKGE